jgi:site-specific DNA-cytosine methylase
VFVDILNHIKKLNPNVKFLLENVRMKKEWQNLISEFVGVEPILINSALVSAQDRKRLYWTNIPGIKQPGDKNIFLKDIIISGIPYTNKSQALTATYQKCVFHDSINKHRRTMIAEDMKCNDKSSKAHIVCVEQEKSPRIYFAEKTTINNMFEVKNNKIILYGKEYEIKLPDGFYMFRKLTPVECERLQTLPDNYTDCVSNSQRYKALGNGWTVDIIVHILQRLKGQAD